MKPGIFFSSRVGVLLLLAASAYGAAWAQTAAPPMGSSAVPDPLAQLESALQKEISTQTPQEYSMSSSRRHGLEDIRAELRAGREDRELIAIGHLRDIDPSQRFNKRASR